MSYDRPLTLPCGLRLPNRVALAPLTNKQSHGDGCLGADELRWLEARAAGGFGLVSTCAAFVSQEARAWEGQLGISDELHLPGLTRLAAALHAHRTPSIVQIHHGGVMAQLAPGPKLGPVDDEPAGVRGATDEDLDRVVADFVRAACLAERAGMDGVEVHGANGYLFTQFLAPDVNTREDGHGGALAGRARLLRRTVQAIRAAVDPGFAVGVRISPVDLRTVRGLVLEDAEQVAAWLSDDGIDFLHLSLADATCTPPHEAGKPPVVSALRRALAPSIPLMVAGGIWTRADAEQAMDLGADLLSLGRAGIAHPDWPRAFCVPGALPALPPWTEAQLEAWSAGPALITYLKRFPGLMVGGRPA